MSDRNPALESTSLDGESLTLERERTVVLVGARGSQACCGRVGFGMVWGSAGLKRGLFNYR